MSIEFSPENERFLASAIASGAFDSREEALDRALDLLRQQQERLAVLRQMAIELPPLPAMLERNQEGYISVRGHRIGLHLILEGLFAGDDADQIHERFPSLPLEVVGEILDFARRNQAAMRHYLEHCDEIDQLLYETGRRGPSMAELRQRWLAKFGKPLAAPPS